MRLTQDLHLGVSIQQVFDAKQDKLDEGKYQVDVISYRMKDLDF
jgi:hypothetical protein